MSKEVKNSKTEVPCGICMNDKDYIMKQIRFDEIHLQNLFQ